MSLGKSPNFEKKKGALFRSLCARRDNYSKHRRRRRTELLSSTTAGKMQVRWRAQGEQKARQWGGEKLDLQGPLCVDMCVY